MVSQLALPDVTSGSDFRSSVILTECVSPSIKSRKLITFSGPAST